MPVSPPVARSEKRRRSPALGAPSGAVKVVVFAVTRRTFEEDQRPGVTPRWQLRVLLTELRQTLGADALEGRSELRLVLPPDAWIDLRAGAEALEQCRAAVAERRWDDVCVAAERAAALLDQQFLVGHDSDWIA